MTVTEARKLAKASTQYGHYRTGYKLSVNCPACRTLVVAETSMHAIDSKGKKLGEVDQLRREVFEHLQWNCTGDEKLFEGKYR